MPQSNITYDTPYNKELASRVLASEMARARKEEPTTFSFRLDSFHNPKSRGWVGSGVPRDYILNGTSATYPPINMRSGMEVSSGGRYAHPDGAVGGGFWNDFAKGFTKGFTSVLDVAAAPLAFVAPEIAAPLAIASKGIKTLAGGGKKARKPRVIAKKGYAAVEDDVEVAKKMGGAESGGAHSGGGMSGGAVSGAGKKKRAVGASDGRAIRAAIVKKIMKERGVKMIEASQIVKREGLYK